MVSFIYVKIYIFGYLKTQLSRTFQSKLEAKFFVKTINLEKSVFMYFFYLSVVDIN